MLYSISLFLHIVAVLGIFASLAIEQAGMFNLRRTSNTAQAREWLSLLRVPRRFMGPSALILLVTGIYMMMKNWGHQVWAELGLVGMILIALMGAVVTRRRMMAIGQAILAADAGGSLSPALRERLADPVLRLSAWTRLGLALGIVFNMAVKPGTLGAVIALIVSTALGALAAQFVGGSSQTVQRPAAQE